MILYSKYGTPTMRDALDGSVVQIYVSKAQRRGPCYFVTVSSPHCEAVVLRRDFDCIPIQVSDWMVTP